MRLVNQAASPLISVRPALSALCLGGTFGFQHGAPLLCCCVLLRSALSLSGPLSGIRFPRLCIFLSWTSFRSSDWHGHEGAHWIVAASGGRP